jgi:hypothetical protein
VTLEGGHQIGGDCLGGATFNLMAVDEVDHFAVLE